MSFPSGAAVLLDSRVTSSLQLSSAQANDGSVIDTWGTFTQATGGSQPSYDSISCGGGPCITHGGLGGPLNLTPTWVANASVAIGIPFSLFVVFRGDYPAGALCEFSANALAGNGVLLTNTGGWTAVVTGPGGTSRIDHADGQRWGNKNEIHCALLTHDGTNAALYVDGPQVGISTDGIAVGTGSFSVPATIGAAHGGSLPLTGGIAAVGFYNRIFSAAERAQVFAEAGGSWRLTKRSKIKYNKLLCGDSVLVAASTKSLTDAILNTMYCCMGVASAQLGGVYGLPRDLGISGSTLVSGVILGEWTGGGKQTLINGNNIVLLEGGVNDFGVGQTVPQINANWLTYATTVTNDMSAKAAFGKQFCVLCTIVGNSNGANRTAVNANIVANLNAWGAPGVTMVLADFGADPVLSSAVPIALYTADGVHPTLIGNQRIGTILTTALIAAGAA